ncbi:MAG: transcriptional regulator PdhR [Lentisphaerae bacterium ADurb.BinA184]|nr:MAG: transcriptional regulator PdhR [Lentisphaerae bacterium ADurb.BinA184]
MRTLPFVIDRDGRHSLTAQVEQGLRQAILTGGVQPGQALPSLLEMAARLGVSEIVVRRAVRRLSEEGLLRGRTRSGIRVCDPRRRPWRASVLYLHWSGPEMYYHSVLSATLAERLHAERVLVTLSKLDNADAMHDFGRIQTLLDMQRPSLAAVEGESVEILQPQLARRGIPFLHLASAPSPLAHGGVAFTAEAAMSAVAAHARACGIRTAWLVWMSPPNAALRPALAAAGIAATELPTVPVPELGNPAGVEAGGRRAVEAYLARRRALPDLIYFGDDFAARGGLAALMIRGLRIPEDVQVISWANRGLGPVFGRPLTRVEMDPVRHGGQVADAVLRKLAQTDGDTPPATRLEPEFIVGETTRGTGSAERGARSGEPGVGSGNGGRVSCPDIR